MKPNQHGLLNKVPTRAQILIGFRLCSHLLVPLLELNKIPRKSKKTENTLDTSCHLIVKVPEVL